MDVPKNSLVIFASGERIGRCGYRALIPRAARSLLARNLYFAPIIPRQEVRNVHARFDAAMRTTLKFPDRYRARPFSLSLSLSLSVCVCVFLAGVSLVGQTTPFFAEMSQNSRIRISDASTSALPLSAGESETCAHPGPFLSSVQTLASSSLRAVSPDGNRIRQRSRERFWNFDATRRDSL